MPCSVCSHSLLVLPACVRSLLLLPVYSHPLPRLHQSIRSTALLPALPLLGPPRSLASTLFTTFAAPAFPLLFQLFPAARSFDNSDPIAPSPDSMPVVAIDVEAEVLFVSFFFEMPALPFRPFDNSS
jgi:hypothetical protein